MRISIEVSIATVETDDSAELFLYLDPEGRDFLVRELMNLEFPAHDHFHIFSSAWTGDGELSEERRDKSSLFGRHLKVHLRPPGEQLFGPEDVDIHSEDQ
jgi:hypothetical protein